MQVFSMQGQAHPYEDQRPFSAGITCALTGQLWRHVDEGQTASGCPTTLPPWGPQHLAHTTLPTQSR